MDTAPRLRFGVTFTLSLIMSWTFATGVLALAGWTDSHTPQHFMTWVSLWVFTVAIPTVQALRIHRRLGEVLQDCAMTSPQVRRDLAHARFVIVMCGSMTVLLVVGLHFGR